jgi:hypothetical protein
VTLFSGKCEGGPFHGKSLYHGEPRIPVAMRGNKVVTYFGRPTSETKIGWYECESGVWIWKAPVSE